MCEVWLRGVNEPVFDIWVFQMFILLGVLLSYIVRYAAESLKLERVLWWNSKWVFCLSISGYAFCVYLIANMTITSCAFTCERNCRDHWAWRQSTCRGSHYEFETFEKNMETWDLNTREGSPTLPDMINHDGSPQASPCYYSPYNKVKYYEESLSDFSETGLSMQIAELSETDVQRYEVVPPEGEATAWTQATADAAGYTADKGYVYHPENNTLVEELGRVVVRENAFKFSSGDGQAEVQSYENLKNTLGEEKLRDWSENPRVEIHAIWDMDTSAVRGAKVSCVMLDNDAKVTREILAIKDGDYKIEARFIDEKQETKDNIRVHQVAGAAGYDLTAGGAVPASIAVTFLIFYSHDYFSKNKPWMFLRKYVLCSDFVIKKNLKV